jgi:hypothetical protein
MVLRTRIGELFGIEHPRHAFESGDRDEGALFIGQDAGLIDRLEPAGRIVERLVREAETIFRRLASVAS